MTRHWPWLMLLLALAGIVFFWPAAIEEEPQTSGGEMAAEAPATTRAPDAVGAEIEASAPGNALNQQAMNAWYAGEIQDAMALFEEAIEAAPDDPEPHTNYGRLLTLMVAYDRALPLLQRANELRPEDAQTWLDLATLYERAQQFSDAQAARGEAVRLVGADAIVRDDQGRFVLKGDSLW